MSNHEIDWLAAKALAIFLTPIGQVALRAVFTRSELRSDQFTKESKPNPASLTTPLGPISPDGLWPHQRR